MKRVLKAMSIALSAVAMMLVLAGQIGLLAGTPPQDLGAREGRLKAPALSPNSVSSQADLHPSHPQRANARIEPLRYSGDGELALAKLAAHLGATSGVRIIKQEAGYLYAECSTPLLRFTDDLELLLDASAGVIHVRSASRLGESDLGANRERVEGLRRVLTP